MLPVGLDVQPRLYDVLGHKQQAGPQIRSTRRRSQAPQGLCNHSFNKTHDNENWHPHLWQLAEHGSSADHTLTHTRLACTAHAATGSGAQACVAAETARGLGLHGHWFQHELKNRSPLHPLIWKLT